MTGTSFTATSSPRTPDGASVLIQVREADNRSVHRIDTAGTSERPFEVDGLVIALRRGAPGPSRLMAPGSRSSRFLNSLYLVSGLR